MLKVDKKAPLGPLTTIKIGSKADFLTSVKSEHDLLEALAWARAHKQEIFILGGGSNILFTKPIKALVIKNEIKGINIISQNKSFALVEAASGEAWSRFVNFTVKNNLFGLENLFLIPGTVGAAPMQNIGAYGVEVKDSLMSLRALDIKTHQIKTFSNSDCKFAYRDSIFKNKYRGRYFILSVTFKLSLKPNFKLDYGSIREELKVQGINRPSAQELINTIQRLRNSKLPNPGVLPSAGSFFKNPIIPRVQLKKLLIKFPDLKYFTEENNKIKIPAGWLIEKAGFKGKKFGRVGMYEKQALVLINYGGATGREALHLVKKIQKVIKNKFDLELTPEVNII